MSTENTIWRATALTLFPDAFPGVLGTSIIGGAEKSGIWQLETVDIRDFSTNRHRSVDSPPSGGGPGMVLNLMCPQKQSTVWLITAARLSI